MLASFPNFMILPYLSFYAFTCVVIADIKAVTVSLYSRSQYIRKIVCFDHTAVLAYLHCYVIVLIVTTNQSWHCVFYVSLL